MSKVVLLAGAGLGKSYIGSLLAADYKSRGIPYKRYDICSFRLEPQVIKTINEFDGFILLETIKLTVEGITPWQTIVFSDGLPLSNY